MKVICKALYLGWMLNDPVKQVGQGDDMAPSLWIGTDGCCPHAGQSAAEQYTDQHHPHNGH